MSRLQDWTAMRLVARILSSVVTRIAVPGARSAPRDTANQSRVCRDIQGRVLDWLKDGDPVAGEPPLPDADVRRMRRDVIAAGQRREPGFTAGRRALLGAATVALAVAAIGVVSWMGESGREPREDGPASGATIAPPVTRQLIFETPGGTRVIWVFNPQFRE